MNPAAAFAVTDPSQIPEARRAVQWLAERLGFSAERAGRATLVASELLTNLARHASRGELLMRPLFALAGETVGIEVLALDRGPGIPDLAISRRDGYSTAGTLGHGLGAVERLADWVDLYTHSTGTAIAARVWRERPPDQGVQTPYDIGAVSVSKDGESVCGDGWAWRMRNGRLSICIADGLGHGLAAHDAATAAIGVFRTGHEQPPARLLEDVHAALRPTRGAAVGVVTVNLENGTAQYAGVGNIAGSILLGGGGRHHLVSHNGTAGHTAGRIQEFTYPMPSGSVLIMYSDGLGSHWDLGTYPGLRSRSASLIAGILYRDFSRRRDDVTVVVAKEHPAVAEKL